MDRDRVWSDATNSTAWKLPSFTVSTLRARERHEGEIHFRHLYHPSCERGARERAFCIPVYSRRRIGSSVVADPEASPVQLHGNVIIIPFIQQHATVLIGSNLKTQQVRHVSGLQVHIVLFTCCKNCQQKTSKSFSGICTLVVYLFFWKLITFTSYVYTNISAFTPYIFKTNFSFQIFKGSYYFKSLHRISIDLL